MDWGYYRTMGAWFAIGMAGIAVIKRKPLRLLRTGYFLNIPEDKVKLNKDKNSKPAFKPTRFLFFLQRRRPLN